MQRRLFIVSNRLPVTIEQTEGSYESRQSSGGLISAISAYLKGGGVGTFGETVWAGVPDCTEKVWFSAQSENKEQADFTYLPVFLNRKKYELYYNGFSNSMLWPLFHYFPSFADYNPSYFEAYMEVNETFADALAKQIKKDDVVWIHDYHLLPLAGMLRKRCPNITIGFFLHIPFPSYELLRVMPKPWQRELLTGMLGADLVGFHTVDYTAHFLSCLEMVLKVEHDGHYVSWQNRLVKVEAFPISIDFDLFNDTYDNKKVAAIREHYMKLKGDKKLLFSVDRLDYTKGVSNRLKGYELFLKQNPEYIGKVMFALVIVPSRDSITKYAERKKIIDEYIGNLNSRLGSISWQPVLYQYSHLTFEELTALYGACDVALITPMRDGMNLVSKEFVASRKDKQGVLVLSEMAGAARELTEALLINPNDTAEIAAMIKAGFEMDAEEQEDRMNAMQDRIKTYDVNKWASDFFDQLKYVKGLQLEFEIRFLDNAAKIQMMDKYANAEKRLLLLDYDGTLVPFSKLPEMAAPTTNVLETLQRLSSNPTNDVYIISGRDSGTLEKWLGHLPLGLIAEHGAKIKYKDGQWKTAVLTDTKEWKQRIQKIMQHYVSKCPGSFIEQKEFSLAWHYRNSDPAHSAVIAKELYDDLLDCTVHLSLNVLNGNKVIEVRAKGINKGVAAEKMVSLSNYDFILSLGDDRTDEDMFRKLAKLPGAFTIKVGNEASFAKYNLHTPAMVQSLLETLSFYVQKSMVVS